MNPLTLALSQRERGLIGGYFRGTLTRTGTAESANYTALVVLVNP
jgi:hypothetical protein